MSRPDPATTEHPAVAEIPTGDVAVPPAVQELAAGDPIRPLWRNELGGLTFALDGVERRVVKWSPHGAPPLATEVERMRWLAERFPAPRVISYTVVDGAELLVTAAIDAESAVSRRWQPHPITGATAIGTGLRRLHALPVDDCPYDWSVGARIAAARADGRTVAERLETSPPLDRLVVCHGDSCSPNTLLDAEGRFAALVDLGELGVADRWADLAIASMALDWNYEAGTGYEQAFWAAYGIDPDHDRIAYYRALSEAT